MAGDDHGKEGKDAAALDCFFAELGKERSEAIEAMSEAMSMDMGPACESSARKLGHATEAVICYDPFRAVQLVISALNKVRRQVWQKLRRLPDQDAARRFKGARWALLKNPDDLNDDQAATLRKLKPKGGDLWRAYALKEALRAVFAGDLSPTGPTDSIPPTPHSHSSCSPSGPSTTSSHTNAAVSRIPETTRIHAGSPPGSFPKSRDHGVLVER